MPDLHCNALGWSGLERIIAGDLPLSPRCIFNQILAPGHWDQCGPNRDKTALQQYRWDQIMSAGANPWRRPTRPACDMLVPLSQDDVEYNRQQLSHVRAAPAQVICLNISDGAEAGQTMNLPQLDPPADPSHVASLRILLEHCRFP